MSSLTSTSREPCWHRQTTAHSSSSRSTPNPSRTLSYPPTLCDEPTRFGETQLRRQTASGMPCAAASKSGGSENSRAGNKSVAHAGDRSVKCGRYITYAPLVDLAQCLCGLLITKLMRRVLCVLHRLNSN